jgi:hypothetical protein
VSPRHAKRANAGFSQSGQLATGYIYGFGPGVVRIEQVTSEQSEIDVALDREVYSASERDFNVLSTLVGITTKVRHPGSQMNVRQVENLEAHSVRPINSYRANGVWRAPPDSRSLR